MNAPTARDVDAMRTKIADLQARKETIEADLRELGVARTDLALAAVDGDTEARDHLDDVDRRSAALRRDFEHTRLAITEMQRRMSDASVAALSALTAQLVTRLGDLEEVVAARDRDIRVAMVKLDEAIAERRVVAGEASDLCNELLSLCGDQGYSSRHQALNLNRGLGPVNSDDYDSFRFIHRINDLVARARDKQPADYEWRPIANEARTLTVPAADVDDAA